MLRFDPLDPFPLVDLERHSVADLRRHSVQVDQWLGFKVEQIERDLLAGGCRRRASRSSEDIQQLWFGLDPQALQTPYVEIRNLLASFPPKSSVVDLGCAYGRMAHVIARCFPEMEFTGYEYVGERVAEGNRVLRKLYGKFVSELQHVDLSARDFKLERADIYFIYDFGTLKAIEKVIFDLKRYARLKPITLVARGRHTRYLLSTRHPWLRPLSAATRERTFTIYQSVQEAELSAASNF